MQRPLIFISHGATTAPLAAFLAERFTLVVPHPGVAEQLRQRGMPAIGWGAFADERRIAALPTLASRMADQWCGALKSHGRPLHQVAGGDHGAGVISALHEVFRKNLAKQMAAVEFATSLTHAGHLEAVVVHEDVTGVTRAFLEATRRVGVPSVHVPHGLALESRIIGADVHGAAHTDFIAAAGVVQRDWYVRRGVASERIILTGNPAWDPLCTRSKVLPSSLGLPDRRVTTVATSWVSPDGVCPHLTSREHDRRTGVAFGALSLLRAKGLNFSVVLKLHPSAPPGDEIRFEGMASQAGLSIDLIARYGLPEILRASTVLVALPSTIAIESVLAGTPVIVPECFFEGGAVLSGRLALDSLARTIEDVLRGSTTTAEFAARRLDFLERYNGRCDGRAAERVSRLVEDIASRATAAAQLDTRGNQATQHEHRGQEKGAALGERLTLARTLASAGKHESALVLLDKVEAQARDRGEHEFFVFRGELLCRLGRMGEAERCLRSAVDCGAGGEAHAQLGNILLERGRQVEADLYFREATRRDPHADMAWCGRGVLAGLRGERREAALLLEKALAINPGNLDAQHALAVLRSEGAGDDEWEISGSPGP